MDPVAQPDSTASSTAPARVETKLSKKQRREKEREERWPKKRRWADAFLQQVETSNPEGSAATPQTEPSKENETNTSGSAVELPSGSAANPEDSERKKKRRKKKHTDQTPLHEKLDDVKDHPAIQYLIQWKKDRSVWTFKKSRQNWLLDHLYHKDLVDKKRFKILLEYIEGMQGKRKSELLTEAETFVKEYDTEKAAKEAAKIAADGEQNESGDDEDPEWKSKTNKYKRCRMVIAVITQ